MATNTKDFVVRYGVRATNFNNVVVTQPASQSTLTIGSGKTVTISNTLTFNGTDSSTISFGSGGTVLYNGGALGTPASATLTNATGLPVSSGISGLGTGVATALAVNTGSAGAFVTYNGALGTPSSATLTNATGLPVSTGISGLGTGVATALATNIGAAGAFITFNGALGTPSSGTLTNATGLPVSTGISGLGTNVATFLATPSSANLASAVTDETGTGVLVFGTSPTFTTSVVAGSATMAVFNTTATTVDAFGAATALSIGASTGTTTVNNNLTVTGNLVVNGTTTTVNSTVISVDDKNLELGSITTPTNTTADGGGITLKGTTDKTFNWVNSTSAWTSSENLDLASGKVFSINGTTVLSGNTLGSGVTSSSLTQVGTIGTGTWQGSVIAGQYGGTGVANTGKTITVSGNTTIGSSTHTVTFATSANTSVTLPTSGTLVGSADTGTIATAMIANSAVTYAKVQNVSATNRVLGRISSGAGVVEELTGDNLVTIINTATTAINPVAGTASFTKNIAVTANSTSFVFDSFATATYTSAEYLIQMKQATGTKMTTTKLLVTWDGTNYNWTEYAIVDGTTAVTYTGFNVVVNGSNTDVSVTSSDGNTNNIVMKVQATYLKA